jgi:flagellar basal-body rod modification protein FlgD
MLIDSTSYGTTGAVSNTSDNMGRQLGMDLFLKILAAQLQNQDPLEEGDNSEFIAQMAQMAAMEQLNNLYQTMQSVLYSQQVLQGNTLIGREVTARLADETTLQGKVTGVSMEAGEVRVLIDGQKISLQDIIDVRETASV